MKPLKVALIVKATPSTRLREDRNMGFWSYAVPEFTWQHFTLGKPFRTSTRRFRDFDLIFMEDGGNWGEFTDHDVPVVYFAIDSTLSTDHHYLPRLMQAAQADLVLVEHDAPERFTGAGKPVRRLPYCVNDQVFYVNGDARTKDVTFHCGGQNERRRAVRQRLHEYSKATGYSYASGVLGLRDYAHAMNESKVVVNVPRVDGNRPHRVFDALACGAAVMSYPFPDSPDLTAGEDYLVTSDASLEDDLTWFIGRDGWVDFARQGHETVMARHTWSVRARELRQMLRKELGL